MKTFTKILIAAAVASASVSCMKYDFNVDYKAPVTISFTGVDNSNIITLEKGVLSYNAEIVVKADNGLTQVVVANADNRTGVASTTLMTKDYYEAEKEVSISVPFEGLTDNACIKVTASDLAGNSVSKNMVVALTPAVVITDEVIAETAEVYYGVYLASWLGGRIYMRSTDGIEQYKSNIDVAFGEYEGNPCLMSPAARKSTYGLTNLEGLHATSIALTSMSAAEYAAINKVDASPINAIEDPTADYAVLTAGNVYVFKRDDGVKGLVYVKSSEAKSAYVQDVDGNWNAETPYHKITVSAKVIAE